MCDWMTREEVIKGLEICTKNESFAECVSKECPFIGGSIDGNCIEMLMHNALALLKEQEPQVMTISDFKDEEVYYLEALPPFVLRPVIYRLDYSDPRHYNFVWKYDQFSWNTDEYGKTWRCWTTRPSDEVRRTTPWEMK